MKKLAGSLSMIACLSLLGCNQESETTKQQETKATTAQSPVVNKSNPSSQLTKTDPYVSPLSDDAPVYKVATTGTQPPFSFQDEFGTLQGIDIDSIRAIGESEGFKVEFFKESWQNVFPSVVEGKRDLAISGISYNSERASKYSLSDSYLFVPSAIMYTKKDLNIKGLGDLEGLKFGGMEGSKQVNDVKSNVKDVNIIESKTMFMSYSQLVRGEVDAIAEDMQWLQFTAEQHPGTKVYITPYENENDTPSQQIIMLKKGNTELLKKINSGIKKLKADGKFKKIEHKWLPKSS